VLGAAAAARRESTGLRRGDSEQREEVEELVLIPSPWFEEGKGASLANMRGHVGKCVEEKGDMCLVQLWRSSQGMQIDTRTYAPAWRRRRDGKELCSRRKEKGFSEPVTVPVRRDELVADVRGRVVKGGTQLNRLSVAWRHLRGKEDGEARGTVV
jgi:hypothetical protein